MKTSSKFYFFKYLLSSNINFVSGILVFLSLIFLSISCKEKEMSYYLDDGLSNYRKLRNVDESILNDYRIQKLAFMRKDSLNYFIFQLNDDARADTINKYGLGVVFYMDKKLTEKNKGFIMLQTQPEMQTFDKYKYVIEPFKIPTSYLDSIHIYLSGRAGYNGVIGDMITLKNIQLD